MKTQTLASGIIKTIALVALNMDKGVYPHKYKTKFNQVELRQEITSTYPAAKVGNDKADNLFATEDFNLGEGKSYTETRVTWMEVPLTATIEQVQQLLDANPTACIQKHIASKPILTSDQERAVMNGITDREGNKISGDEVLANIVKNQLVRNSDGDLVDAKGDLIEEQEEGVVAPEDVHRLQYRALYFKKEYTEDIDTRIKTGERVAVAPTQSVPATEVVKA